MIEHDDVNCMHYIHSAKRFCPEIWGPNIVNLESYVNLIYVRF